VRCTVAAHSLLFSLVSGYRELLEMNISELEKNRRQRRLLIMGAVLVLGAVALGIGSRVQMQHTLQNRIESSALIVVETMKPTLENSSEEIMLPGDVQAYADAPIYARTSGYLKRWLVDIGAHVKKGQLLAEIDVPELDQQLLQAQADLANTQATAQLAASTATRWTELLASDSVSKQDADEKIGDALAKKSQVASARANVARLKELQGYKNLVAPFSGVVTARNVDIGALVNAASGAELFRISASEKLRVYVRAPQYYAPFIKPGLEASLEFAERPGVRYPGIDAQCRSHRCDCAHVIAADRGG
jgi:RND family efflux transporter MFP subunit